MYRFVLINDNAAETNPLQVFYTDLELIFEARWGKIEKLKAVSVDVQRKVTLWQGEKKDPDLCISVWA